MTDPTPESGRELDAVVAEEVFGWKRTTWEKGKKVAFHLGGGGELPREFTFLADPKHSPVKHYRSEQAEEVGELVALDLPHYSTDIAAAWEVVEKLRDRDTSVSVGVGPDSETGPVCGVTIKRLGYREFQDRKWGAFAATAPLAICRAALRAVRADTEGDDG